MKSQTIYHNRISQRHIKATHATKLWPLLITTRFRPRVHLAGSIQGDWNKGKVHTRRSRASNLRLLCRIECRTSHCMSPSRASTTLNIIIIRFIAWKIALIVSYDCNISCDYEFYFYVNYVCSCRGGGLVYCHYLNVTVFFLCRYFILFFIFCKKCSVHDVYRNKIIPHQICAVNIFCIFRHYNKVQWKGCT